MNSDSYRDFLLRSIPSAKQASGGREVVCRCFYCPDSKDIRHGHFYISIPENKDQPSLYHCMKCHTSGMVTNRTLLDWGIYDDNIAVELVNHNKNINPNLKRRYIDDYVYNISNSYINQDNLSMKKLDYINNRLGTMLTFSDMERLKIVLNLTDLLKSNNIDRITRNNNIIDQLDKSFIGFLSLDNAFLNMRRIVDKDIVYKTIDKRYVNYSIFGKENSQSRFYVIPNVIDLSQPERVKIHIAEGPFDIISIYENLRLREPGFYVAIGGSNYYGTAINLIYKYKLPYCEVHLYPDNDDPGNDKRMSYIKDKLNSVCVPVIIHRNIFNGEKDFGVPISRIKEVIL